MARGERERTRRTELIGALPFSTDIDEAERY
jgi:hypothetical protein